MVITKHALPRRTFLQGLGAGIALPFLDAMVPALGAASVGPVQRLGFFYVPNGMFLPNFHPAGEGGTAFELTPILKPLEGLRDQVVVVSGLSNMPVLANDQGGGVHTRNHAGWLSGVLPKRTEGANCQSPSSQPTHPPLFTGLEATSEELKLCRISKLHGPYSAARLVGSW